MLCQMHLMPWTQRPAQTLEIPMDINHAYFRKYKVDSSTR